MSDKRCRSRSPFGNCGLPQGHQGNHAVPIGGDVWFGYTRRTRQRIGYMLQIATGWTLL